MATRLGVAAALLAAAAAQDPAQGWLGYAKGVSPTGTGILTRAEAKWVVGGTPKEGGAFYSPWLGIEASDNLNLIQPVNPWMGSSWAMYIEYFQWSPTKNYDSPQHTVSPGDVLHGVVTYNPGNSSYTITHTDLTDGWSVTSVIPIQKSGGVPKNYTICYIVFEKPANCDQYPPEGIVTFYDVALEYDNAPVTPTWTTGIVDDVCNNRAAVVNASTIQITWDTSAANPPAELVAKHQNPTQLRKGMHATNKFRTP